MTESQTLKTCRLLTCGDEDGEQAGHAAHGQEGQLGDLARAVEREQGDGAGGHLHQAEDHLGQVDVHAEVGDVEREAVVDEDVGEPEGSRGRRIRTPSTWWDRREDRQMVPQRRSSHPSVYKLRLAAHFWAPLNRCRGPLYAPNNPLIAELHLPGWEFNEN